VSLSIDFVSDIACPWCAVGLHGLLQALGTLKWPVELRCQPFELNPDLGPEGRNIVEYLTEKIWREARAHSRPQAPRRRARLRSQSRQRPRQHEHALQPVLWLIRLSSG
jgi:predicted DsbA family dithiol-disulfide isomerase